MKSQSNGARFRNVPFLLFKITIGMHCSFLSLAFATDVSSSDKTNFKDTPSAEETIACKVSSDCFLIRKPCGGFDSYNKQFRAVIEEAYENKAKLIHCNKSEFVSADRNPLRYIAECVKGKCEAKVVEKTADENPDVKDEHPIVQETKLSGPNIPWHDISLLSKEYKPGGRKELPPLLPIKSEETSCKVSDECAKLRDTCGRYQAFNRKYVHLMMERAKQLKESETCNPRVPEMDSDPEVVAECVQGICQAKEDNQEFIHEKPPVREAISKAQALQIGEKELVAKYGEAVLEQRPFTVVFKSNLWVITGTFHCAEDSVCKGGVAKAVLLKDGTLVGVDHGK